MHICLGLTTYLKKFFFLLTLVISSVFSASIAVAAPKLISFQSKIYKPDGTPLEASSVQFKFSLMNPLSTCVIYSETFSNVDLSSSSGSVVLALGDPVKAVRSYPTSGSMKWYDAFNNTTPTYTCQTTGTFSPTLLDNRRLVMQFNDGGGSGWQTLPPMDINSVPFAMFAELAETVPASGILQGGATPGQVLKWTGTSWAASTDNSNAGGVSNVSSATSYLSVANGGTAPVLTINVGTGINTVAAGDDARITGAFQSATSLSGDLTGTLPNATIAAGAVTNSKITSMAFSKLIGIPTTLSGHSITMTSSDITTALGYTPGNGSGLVSSVSADTTSGNPITVGGSASAKTINLPKSTASANGYLASGDFTTFSSKLNANQTAIEAALGYVPVASGLTSSYIFVGNASNLAVGVQLSGDATISNTGVLSLVNSGVGVGTYSKVTVDLKGRVTASGVLNSGDVTTALGYLAASSINSVQTLTARVATTANIALTGTQTIDGVAVIAGDRVLVKNQTTQSQNGIYVAAAGAWARASDLDSWAEVVGYSSTISEGAAWAGMNFVSMETVVGTIGTTAIRWSSNGSGSATSSNTAVGLSALNANSTGNSNVAFGSSALSLNNTGTGNTGVGGYALGNNTSGSYNVAIGYASMNSGTTGGSNTAVGFGAANATNTGEANTAFGASALSSNRGRGESTAIGFGSMQNADNAGTAVITYNTAIGAYSLKGHSSASLNTGVRNTALGHSALFTTTIGSGNIAVGYNAGSAITSGDNNVVIGSNTGSSIAALSNNILIADGAGNERIRVNSIGQVGIGTSSPTFALTVSGDVNVTGNFKINGVNLAAGGGTVTSVNPAATADNPITVTTTTTTPTIDIARATAFVNGYLASSDFSIFLAKGSGSVTSATAASTSGNPITVSASGTSPSIDITKATAFVNGYLSSSDFSTFNGKQAGSTELTNLAAIATTGFMRRTAANTYSTVASMDLTTQVMGTLPAVNGGTGQSSYATGDLLYASSASALTRLPASTSGFVLTSTGTTTAPAWQAPTGGSMTCPTNYILVPKLSGYTVKDFCVAKYEMKDDGYGQAISQATGSPWVSINRPTSRSACQALGVGYDLISNDQWQTMARDIADVASNWSTGTVYSGELNRGHSDLSPGSYLIADASDVNACSGTGQTCSNTVWNSQRRTHRLSNGNVVWDFAGNVWEWVTNNNTVANATDSQISTFSSGIVQQKYGNDQFCGSPVSSPWCGFGQGMVNYIAGAVFRGGAWNDGSNAGVFAAALLYGPSVTDTLIGFRCVYQP